MKECPNKLGLRHLHPNPYLQIMKNVSIVMLMVMTLTIVTHCIQNSILTNLPTTRMVEAKEDVGEAMETKGKTTNKVSSKANNQGQGDGMAITHD